jgi:hypothetical protein
VVLVQSDNPKEPSRQTVQSEQTLEYVLPPGTAITLGGSDPRVIGTNGPLVTRPGQQQVVTLPQAVPVRMISKERRPFLALRVDSKEELPMNSAGRNKTKRPVTKESLERFLRGNPLLSMKCDSSSLPCAPS